MDNGPETDRLGAARVVSAVADRAAPTSIPAPHGRTPSSSPSTAESETSCSTSRTSPTFSKPSHCRSVADRVQHLPSPLGPGRPHPRPVRQTVDPATPTNTPAIAGPTFGDPSPQRQPLRSVRPASLPLECLGLLLTEQHLGSLWVSHGRPPIVANTTTERLTHTRNS